MDLSGCGQLKELGEECFKYCKNAEVKLPASIKVIRGSFEWDGYYYERRCRKILVPNEEIKNLVNNSGYSGTIEIYTP